MSADLDLERLADLLRSTDQLSNIDVALEVADIGIAVLATVPGGKGPLLTREHIDGSDRNGEMIGEPCQACRAAGLKPAADQGATLDPDTIRRCWSVHPDAGVGMRGHPRLVRGDADHDDAKSYKDTRKRIGYAQPDGVPEPFAARTPGGLYRRRYLHWIPDGVPAPGGGTKLLGVSWYGSSGQVVIKGRHPSGNDYPTFDGVEITELPETIALNLRRRGHASIGQTADVANSHDVTAFLAAHSGTQRLDQLARRRKRVAQASAGDRHPTALTELVLGFREAIAGWYPAQTIHDAIRQALSEAGWGRDRLDGTEWTDLVAWAVGQIDELDRNAAIAKITADRYQYELHRLEQNYTPDDDGARDLTDAELEAIQRHAAADTDETAENEPTVSDTHLELVDWPSAFDGEKRDDAIVDGLVIPGRWTAVGAPGKAGKSTLLIAIAVAISLGRDPFDGSARPPATLLYLDAEMGRLDVVDRLRQLGYGPDELTALHYTDLVPKLDIDQGAARLLTTVKQLQANVVILDGINGFAEGPENDDTTWRHLFENAIAPLKRAGVAVLTADNLGKDKAKGLRGSTVKVDKPDAVIIMARTDRGVSLTATHRRTVDYPSEQLLNIVGIDGSEPIRYRHADYAVPAGTAEAIAILDELGIPIDYGRGRASDMLAEARDRSTQAERDRYRIRNEVLAAALRARRNRTTLRGVA